MVKLTSTDYDPFDKKNNTFDCFICSKHPNQFFCFCFYLEVRYWDFSHWQPNNLICDYIRAVCLIVSMLDCQSGGWGSNSVSQIFLPVFPPNLHCLANLDVFCPLSLWGRGLATCAVNAENKKRWHETVIRYPKIRSGTWKWSFCISHEPLRFHKTMLYANRSEDCLVHLVVLVIQQLFRQLFAK